MNKTPVNPSSGRSGFTLLEVLIAVMILGLSLTAILQQFAVALRAGTAAQDITVAILHAKEKLEELKIRKDLAEGAEDGSFDDGYEWETRIEPYSYAGEQDAEAYETLKHETFKLTSTVKWRSGVRQRHVDLTTLRTTKKKEWD